MRFAWSLRTRFLLASSVLVLALCAVFAFAVHEFIELLEDEMLNRTLVREMQEFKRDAEANPAQKPPSAGGLSGFMVRSPADRKLLPGNIADLSKGVHEDVFVNNHVYYIAVDDSTQGRIFLLLDTQRVEALESNVITVALLVGLFALGFAGIASVALARAVVRPVTELADRVEHLDPAHPQARLGNQFANREIGVIAAALDGYMERLKRVLEREQAFTEDASHELRTPLSIISSAAELLAEEPGLSTAGVERLARIRRACTQTQSLIEALLFLARGETGRPIELCALDRIVTEATDMVTASVGARSVEVSVEVEPVVVRGSPVMVACVVNNLLLNAMHFTQQGSIEVVLSPDTLTVRDTGLGIPPEDLSRIFERRYRGAQSRGLGLGLYLVNRICDRLGWAIEIESRAGQGTTFKIRLQASVVAVAVEHADA